MKNRCKAKRKKKQQSLLNNLIIYLDRELQYRNSFTLGSFWDSFFIGSRWRVKRVYFSYFSSSMSSDTLLSLLLCFVLFFHHQQQIFLLYAFLPFLLFYSPKARFESNVTSLSVARWRSGKVQAQFEFHNCSMDDGGKEEKDWIMWHDFLRHPERREMSTNRRKRTNSKSSDLRGQHKALFDSVWENFAFLHSWN